MFVFYETSKAISDSNDPVVALILLVTVLIGLVGLIYIFME